MKIFVASDIHGSEYYCRKMTELFSREKCDKMVLLGDILYHGPRNDLPRDYNPKGVITLLDALADKILCVRGNCDAEVDQMVLSFPIMAEYGWLFLNGKRIYLTHGHKAVDDTIKKGADIVLFGHTHIPQCVCESGVLMVNPGSVAIPKEESKNSCLIIDEGILSWYDLSTSGIYKNYKIEN